MKSKISLVIGGLTVGLLIAISATLIAGPVTLPNTFTKGTPAVASEVNANFNAIKTAVDDNNVRIVTIESNVNAGNVVLAPSTATDGNILKGADRFIHNFGTDNTFLGLNAGNFTMTGGKNTASGVGALFSNTTGNLNTASGFQALFSNTTGSRNTASGVQALSNNTTGNFNTASGFRALSNDTTGNFNTASGFQALSSNTAGGDNTANGVNALFSNTAGNNNTASGVQALLSNTTGSRNTASGQSALFDNTTGNSNIAIGFSAGTNLTTGNGNIDIGNTGVAAEEATIRIGTASAQTRAFIAGISGVGVTGAQVLVSSSGQLGVATSSRRFKDHITDMGVASDLLMHLRPVTFYYQSDQNRKGRSLQYGLVAEEVAQVAPELVAHSTDGEIETVYYQFLAPMLLNEYQKQQRTIQAQATTLMQQTARVAELEHERRAYTVRIEALESQTARMAAVLSRLQQAGTLTTAGR